MYRASQAEDAREQLSTWVLQWGPLVPDTVATLARDFEHTLVYYQLNEITREWIRTTSLLERTNRELRRKFRQAVTFGSRSVPMWRCSCKSRGFMLAGPRFPGGRLPMTFILLSVISTLRERYNIYQKSVWHPATFYGIVDVVKLVFILISGL